jgi:hypothetical protein
LVFYRYKDSAEMELAIPHMRSVNLEIIFFLGC